MSTFGASDYFGFNNVVPISGGAAATTSQAVPTTITSVEQAAAGSAARHPAIALFGLVLVAAALLEHTTRPVAGARAEANIGGAKGEIGGEL